MKTLESKLGYTFEDISLLDNALTHSSCANESRGKLQSNERLEFLGDAILGMVVADHLYRNHPDLPEGELTRTRAALVCEESLVEVARKLDLGQYLKLGRGEDAGGGRKRCPGKNVWAFTGFLLDRDLLSGRVGDAALVRQMLGCIDVLVDGPFVLEKKDLALRFRGSSNQRLIDVPATLSSGEIVLWDDGYQRGGHYDAKGTR